MPSETPDNLEQNVAYGVAKAAIEWTEEKIQKLVNDFKNKEIGFIGDREVIEVVRAQRSSAEWKNYSKWIKNKEFRILIQLGISLRKLENKSLSLHELREKIRNKYGTKGLHIAEFTQNKVLGKYIESLLESCRTDEEIGLVIESFLNDIERFCVFIKGTDSVDSQAEMVKTRVYSLAPKIIVLYSFGEATKIAVKIQKK